jgi:2-haloacid dehalogenase
MMTAAPAVVVFDVNETLLDINSLAPLFERLFGDARAVREWFAQLVMYSMTATLCEHYLDFSTLGQGVLRMMADIHRIDVTADDVHSLKHGMLTMPPHDDVEEGLTALRDKGFRLVTLTNSPPDPECPTALEHAGLAPFFDRTFSVDACRAFKPAPVVYRHVCEELQVAPADCMMVAAHTWDTAGAQAAGFSGALITRPGNAPLRLHGFPQPTVVADDVRELARRLCGSRS